MNETSSSSHITTGMLFAATVAAQSSKAVIKRAMERSAFLLSRLLKRPPATAEIAWRREMPQKLAQHARRSDL